jgi:hypothetical protein
MGLRSLADDSPLVLAALKAAAQGDNRDVHRTAEKALRCLERLKERSCLEGLTQARYGPGPALTPVRFSGKPRRVPAMGSP